MILWWDYACDQCGASGSVPIDEAMSVLNAAGKVAKAHSQFNPDCHRNYQGRWVRVRHVSVYDGKCMYGHSIGEMRL